MAKRDHQRWWDWRVNQTSGRSIRGDDKRGRGGGRGTPGTRDAWWWTVAVRDAECMSCGRQLLRERMAYHHRTKRILCPDCAQAEFVAERCRPSRKLLKAGI